MLLFYEYLRAASVLRGFVWFGEPPAIAGAARASLAARGHAAAGLDPINCRPQVLSAAISVHAIRGVEDITNGACRDVDVVGISN
jgi:hypothetical protein